MSALSERVRDEAVWGVLTPRMHNQHPELIAENEAVLQEGPAAAAAGLPPGPLPDAPRLRLPDMRRDRHPCNRQRVKHSFLCT